MHDQSTEMVNGIRAYLQVHFPGVEFIATDDVKKKSLLLHAGGQPRYRLLVSQRFLQADEGVAKSLCRLDEWDLARAIRESRNKLVMLATTGLEIVERAQWPPSFLRR